MSLPITPLPQADVWTETLTAIAAGPLHYCPDFPVIAQHHEDFWACANSDLPLFLASANKNPDRPITRRLDLLERPDEWLAAKQLDLQQQHWVGDMFPIARVDFGPVMMGALFGAPVEFISDTTWTHAFINEEWSNAPDWTIAEDNRYWQLLQELSAVLAEDAAGRYVVMLPDLGGFSDVLLNLRGSMGLCMDVLDKPDIIRASQDAMYASWHRAFTRMREIIIGTDADAGAGAGVTMHLHLWSNRPYFVPASDFNALLGPAQFNELVLPGIVRQAKTVGRAIFHLDGPDAARHGPALCEQSDIQAIQYVTGAGHSVLEKLDLLHQIQASGKALQVVCMFDEVLPLCDELDPAGLCFLVTDVPGPHELDALYAAFCERYGVR